ncbi:helix-turn-helix domain-containing protein, partial [Microbacterium aurantiacum]
TKDPVDDRDATPGAHPCPDVVSATRSPSRRPPNLHRWIEAKRHDSRGAVAKNPAKSQTRLTIEQRMELVADYEAGMPVRIIAVKYGVHRGTIPAFVLRSGGQLRSTGLNNERRASAAILYRDGHTLQEVADRLGIDPKTVRNAVVAEGVTLRPRGRRPTT